MSKKYTTVFLDEAAYFVIKGHRYSAKRTGVVSAVFGFVDTPELARDRKTYFTGVPTVSLHKWLSVRGQMKMHLRSLDITKTRRKKVTVRPKIEQAPSVGTPYYYVDGGSVMYALYGHSNKVHEERRTSGNFYFTKEEAEDYLEGKTSSFD
jgi:hypothetical protein